MVGNVFFLSAPGERTSLLPRGRTSSPSSASAAELASVGAVYSALDDPATFVAGSKRAPRHVPAPSTGRMGVLGVAVISFASVAGGPYGIESAVGVVGALPTLVGLIITAFIWTTTQALVATELAVMFPSNSGSVAWVLAGLGPTLGYINALVAVLANCANAPLYTQTISASIAQLVPLSHGQAFMMEIASLLLAAGINCIGVEAVERLSAVLVILAQSPFIIAPIIWAARGQTFQWAALGEAKVGWAQPHPALISTILWNSAGFASVGNLAGECKDPARTIPRGVVIAIVAVTLNYVLGVLVMVPIDPPTSDSDWSDGQYVAVAAKVSLGPWTAVCCALACLSTLTSQLALSARALQCVVQGRFLPRAFDGLAYNLIVWRTPSPVPALLTSCFLMSLLALLSFNDLVILELLLANVGLILLFASFLSLKHSLPHASRPFAVPGGVLGAWAVSLPFFSLIGLLLYANALESASLDTSLAVAAACVLLAVAGARWARGANVEETLERLAQGEGGDGHDVSEAQGAGVKPSL